MLRNIKLRGTEDPRTLKYAAGDGRAVPRPPLVWHNRSGEIILDRTCVMGVLNVTPDSFSNGGRYAAPEAAIRRGIQIAEEGAAILDIGGESTRPGSDPVPADEEWRRVAPVLQSLARKIDIPISIDTRKAEIAEKAVAAGAAIVNDITGLSDPRMVRLVAKSAAGAVIMHMRGEPKSMQIEPRYSDVLAEIRTILGDRAKAAMAAGVPREAIAVDPGIGFGKKVDHNLVILRGLGDIGALGYPVVIGASRKSFLAALGAGERVEDRLSGSLTVATLAVVHGAHVVRTHDVLETVRAVRVADAVLRGGD